MAQQILGTAAGDIAVASGADGTALGVVGGASSWLVASEPSAESVRRRWGPEVVVIDPARLGQRVGLRRGAGRCRGPASGIAQLRKRSNRDGARVAAQASITSLMAGRVASGFEFADRAVGHRSFRLLQDGQHTGELTTFAS